MQDSLVVCRLRRSSEFRPSDSPNRASSSQRHVPGGNYAISEVGLDQSGVSAGDKAVGNSHDSYSIEQIESTSESEQKLGNEATLAETSSHQKVSYSSRPIALFNPLGRQLHV